MFSSFSLSPDNKGGGPANQSDKGKQPAPARETRTRRQQVSRACVWCRTYRIKCDSSYPCRNCVVKRRECTDEKGKGTVRTFPHAMKEIDRLRERVKELESQLGSTKLEERGDAEKEEDCIKEKLESRCLPKNLDPLNQFGGNRTYYNWDYTFTQSTQSTRTLSTKQCYGPSSSFYFIDQMKSFLDLTLQDPASRPDIDFPSTTKCFGAISSTFLSPVMPSDAINLDMPLSRPQEEYLLRHFWGSYSWIYPIVDGDEFRAHYDSLWDDGDSSMLRKPSALVDIILAVCMQSEAAMVTPQGTETGFQPFDTVSAVIAGRNMYLRSKSQTFMTDELDGPSIRTFQCYLYSVIYLSNACFHNMAHSVMALAIRTGVILGLHMEPPPSLSPQERDLRKRLWWTAYALEMKCGMELGRPLAVHFSQVSCTIPDNNPEFLVPSERDMHMKAFNSQYIKLVLTTRAIYITYYRKCAEVLSSKGASTSTRRNLYQDPRDLEACAEFLSSKAIYFKTWLSQVPDSLKTPRQAPGEPFSTDQSPLVFSDNHSDRPWLPLQRLVLEILYHNHCMHLYRPFINFTSTSKPPSPQNPHPPIPTPHTSRHATACATHAIAMTHILHQVQTQNNVLNGWYQVYQWQWNAALSLVGSIIANPGAPTTEAARRALDVAMRVFGHLSPACAAAVEAGRVTGELVGIVDGVVARWEGLRGREQEQEQRCGLQQQQQQQGTASSGHGTVDPVLLQEEFSATPFDFNAEQFNDAFQFPVDSSLNMNVFFDEFGGVGSEPTGGWGFPDFLNFGGLEGFGSGDGSPEQHGDSGGQGSRS